MEYGPEVPCSSKHVFCSLFLMLRNELAFQYLLVNGEAYPICVDPHTCEIRTDIFGESFTCQR